MLEVPGDGEGGTLPLEWGSRRKENNQMREGKTSDNTEPGYHGEMRKVKLQRKKVLGEKSIGATKMEIKPKGTARKIRTCEPVGTIGAGTATTTKVAATNVAATYKRIGADGDCNWSQLDAKPGQKLSPQQPSAKETT